MRISSKGRYAVAALTQMAMSDSGNYITIVSLAKRLDISKVYLEQVFSILKRSGLVSSGKGAQGGYLLRRRPEEITAYDILSPIELYLFEGTEKTVAEAAGELEAAMESLIWHPLDDTAKTLLSGITLADLAKKAESLRDSGYMYYI